MKKALAIAALLLSPLLITSCAKRQIDPTTTGSVTVPGTGDDHGLQKFCDGSTLIYWTPGYSGEEDQYEFIVYNSEECTGERTPDPTTADLDQGDDD